MDPRLRGDDVVLGLSSRTCQRLPLAFAPAVFAMTDEALLDRFRAAHDADAVYRNALYLYLRIAGTVWIVLEWIAAIVLWRAYRFLSAAVADGEGGR